MAGDWLSIGDARGCCGCEVIALSGFSRCSWSGPRPSLISARESGTTLLCQPLSAWNRTIASLRLGVPSTGSRAIHVVFPNQRFLNFAGAGGVDLLLAPRGSFSCVTFCSCAKFESDIEDTVKSLAWDWFPFAPEDPGLAGPTPFRTPEACAASAQHPYRNGAVKSQCLDLPEQFDRAGRVNHP